MPFGVQATLWLSSDIRPKSENPFFAKTQNGCRRLGFASKCFGEKTKVFGFVNIWSSAET